MRKNTLTLNSHSLPLVEYQGQRVVTFEMVDNVHQRPGGTARASFNRNRQHFIEGTDYMRASPDDYRAIMNSAYVKRTRKKSAKMITEFVTLLSESGYLMLVKSFRDRLSWQIQRLLVNHYFRAVPEFPELHHVAVPDMAMLAGMPVQEAQHIVTRAESESFREHG
ncbi:ORF6N domain-containing protein, partial [Enterobacter ludwigii]|uniref:ORF6N domain-containing protein n=1 Tax=Enterobacter ludwigii TaxID=299767 RepID=UPI000643B43C